MKRYMSYLLFLSCFMVLTPLYAGTQTLTTTYPSPIGSYLNLTVGGTQTFAAQASPCVAAGASIVLTNVTGSGLEVCDSLGNIGFVEPSTLWALGSGAGAAYIYPADVNPAPVDICIGTSCSSTNPNAALAVNGNTILGAVGSNDITTINGNTAGIGNAFIVNGTSVMGGANDTTKINGQVVLGSGAATDQTTINGITIVNNAFNVVGALAKLEDGATVTGNTVLGTVAGNTTTINGTTTVTGDTTINPATAAGLTVNGNGTVTGNTTFGTSGSPATTTTTIYGATTVNGDTTVTGNTTFGTSGGGNATSVQGDATITGNATISGTTTICSSPGVCGTLGVSCSGGTCYAVYGP